MTRSQQMSRPPGRPSLFLLFVIQAGAFAQTIDLAEPAHRGLWLSHPVIGEVSYDTFVRATGNPIYTGAPPYEWPVNGFLFRDPKSGDLYCYIGLYPKGYWPAGPCRAMRSHDDGRAWQDLGIVLQGDKDCFDGDGKNAGAMPDVSVVADDAGYHMVYDWAKPDNKDGGLAYAFATSPEGPWRRHREPLHAESKQAMIPPGYRRVYAGTLVKRKADWLVLAAMSTPGNAGGTWAFIATSAPRPEGPWTPPVFIRSPQRSEWFPQPVEFFPAFTHAGDVYANLTSVAANRSYQLLLKAPIEDAHKPEGWTVAQAGSLFHAEPIRTEARGIWGQAFSGLVDPAGLFRIMYPARNDQGVGTINVASRPWDRPFRKGFYISGPNAPSLGLIMRKYRDFTLDAEFTASGDWQVIWNHRASLGPDRSTADAMVSPLTLTRMNTLTFDAGAWRIEDVNEAGTTKVLAAGTAAKGPAHRVRIIQKGTQASVEFDGTPLGSVDIAEPHGSIGLLARTGTCIDVSKLELSGRAGNRSFFLLPTEGLIGAGQTESKWTKMTDGAGFRFGIGYVADFDGAQAKWNFEGRRAVLHAPRGPAYGCADLFLDDRGPVRLRFRENAAVNGPIWESDPLPAGRHAIRIIRAEGKIPADCLEFEP